MPTAHTAADSLTIEAAAVEIRHLAAVGTVAGVAPQLAAARNGPGAGRVRTDVQSRLQYKAPGSDAWGQAEPVATAGQEILLTDGDDRDKWLRVAAWPAHLTPGEEARVLLGDRYENGATAGDVTDSEAAAGDVATYEITLTNASGHTAERIRAWLDAATADVEISADGVAWVSPTTEGTGLELASLAPGAAATLYARRTIAAAATADTGVLNLLHFAFDGL